MLVAVPPVLIAVEVMRDVATTARFVVAQVAVSHHNLAGGTQIPASLTVSHLVSQSPLKLTPTDIRR